MSSNALLFVRSEIDDLGLSAPAFRVLAHLFRRLSGPKADPEMPPGIPSIMRHCRLSKATVRRALKELEAATGLQRIKRDGKPWKFVLPTLETLRQPGYLFNPGAKKGRPKIVGSGDQSNTRHPSQKRGEEGDPIKEILQGRPAQAPALVLESEGAKKKGRRDEAFEAILEACGYDVAQCTPALRGSANKALAQIRAVMPGMDTPALAAEIRLRARRYHDQWPDRGAFGPGAIAKEWAALDGSRKSRRDRALRRATEQPVTPPPPQHSNPPEDYAATFREAMRKSGDRSLQEAVGGP